MSPLAACSDRCERTGRCDGACVFPGSVYCVYCARPTERGDLDDRCDHKNVCVDCWPNGCDKCIEGLAEDTAAACDWRNDR